MTRAPPRLPRLGIAHRSLRRPPLPRNDVPLFGPQNQSELERSVPIVVEERSDRFREHRRLNEPHGSLYAVGVPPAREITTVSRKSATGLNLAVSSGRCI